MSDSLPKAEPSAITSKGRGLRWRRVEQLGWITELVALRAIDRNEEITRRYSCAPWFRVVA